MKLNSLHKLLESQSSTAPMPVLFLGHGSPMNAIEENEFVQGFRNIAAKIPFPKAILCVSAHWETKGTWVTAMENPKTIHDFSGFPKELYQVQYNAPGSPEYALFTKNLVQGTEIGLDQHWGLDHGSWSVIKHLYPEANVPVFQLSLNINASPAEQYQLAKELSPLRTKGILIIGSGNIIHNLRMVAWSRMNESFAFDWAEEADSIIKAKMLDGNHPALLNYSKLGKSVQLAIPSADHFLPLLYVLGLQDKKDQIQIFNDKPLAGALSMTSLILQAG